MLWPSFTALYREFRRDAIVIAAAAGVLLAGASSALAKTNNGKVSLACVSQSKVVKLKIYIDIKQRHVSAWNDKTGKWEMVRSPWIRIYGDQFQIDDSSSARLHLLIDRQTGLFRYSADTLEQARSAKPIGECEKTRDRALPKPARTVPKPANKF